MRAMFLAEQVVRILDPKFELLENLQVKGPEVLKAAMEQSVKTGSLDRMKHEVLLAAHDLPAALSLLLRRLGPDGEGIAFNLRIRELHGVKEHIARSINRLALALVTLGLYVSGALLMQHSIGPRVYGDIPILAIIAFVLALWFTFRLARGISRSEGP
jgi:ubiquinone biosynthesis protein